MMMTRTVGKKRIHTKMPAWLILAGLCLFVRTGQAAGAPVWLVPAGSDAPSPEGLACTGMMQTDFAEEFNVFYYEDGSRLIRLGQSGDFYVMPGGSEAPEDLPEGTRVLEMPVENVYLAATAAMSLVDAIGAMPYLSLTGTDVSGWKLQAPIDALERGDLVYAGKYSAPDYELLVTKGCSLAIENTMILHTPEVQEMLEDLGIPVWIDRSSYESTGLGRAEWAKAYGALFGEEDNAWAFFAEQKAILDEMETYGQTGLTVAFFSVRPDGTCVIRRPDDYIASMIADAGGVYAFADFVPRTDSATAVISMEEFCRSAADADFLVYNGTIDSGVDGRDALLGKSELFADFRAFKEGNIWYTDSSLYQATDRAAQLIRDFHIMLTDGDPAGLTFLRKAD